MAKKPDKGWYISPAAQKLIDRKVDELFDRMKAKVLGPGYVQSRAAKKIFIGVKPQETIPGLYMASATSEGGTPTQAAMDALVKVAEGYLEAQRHVVKARVAKQVQDFLIDARNKGVDTDVKTVLGGQLADVFANAQKMVHRIVTTEATNATNMGAADAIVKINEASGIDDPVVFFKCMHDNEVCDECLRLHTMGDAERTPRLWRMSELGAGYHKVGDATPKLGGLHPHERCVLASMMPGYGFKDGRITWIGEDHDELAKQRG